MRVISSSQRLFRICTTAFVLIASISISHAKVSEKEREQLRHKLTPFGAERAGNLDGNIPAWNTNIQSSIEKNETIKDEHALFEINADNYENYQEFLSEGQIELLKTYPQSFSMPIYKTHRTHHLPEWQYDSIYKNAVEASLYDEGNGLHNAWPGVVFPIPKSGLEALWNHLTAWKGHNVGIRSTEVTSNDQGTLSYIKSKGQVSSPYYDIDRPKVIEGKQILHYYLNEAIAPASLAGGALLIHDHVNARITPRRAWIYISGQKRVRRLPSLGYDTPSLNSEHIRVWDEVDVFNGSPDLYDWKLMGKKEMYIPYNALALKEHEGELSDLMGEHHIKSDKTRYELHRVWVLEATLKPGKRHIYPKRRLYLDEDTWLALVAENFNHKDELWRVTLSHPAYYSDMPGVWKVFDAFHDIKKELYYVQALTETNFFDGTVSSKQFTPSALRRKSTR